jgi:Restriction endonuclease
MASRRRRKQDGTGAALVVLAIVVAAGGAAASIALKALAVAVSVLGLVLCIFVVALGLDAAGWLYARSSGRPRPPSATRGVLAIVLWPFRLLRRVRDWLDPPLRVETLGQLLALTPPEFEEAVATMLRDGGYRDVRRVGRSGDLCVDITCRDPKGRSLAVQCKRYGPGRRVGSRDIQTFIGMTTTHHRVDRGVFVTTSGYTAPAEALARRHGIRLIGGRELARIVAARASR